MNRFLNAVLTDSPLESPFAPKKKPWIAAALAATAATIGTIASSESTRKTNEANKEMNQSNIDMQRETNAMQYKMFQESNAFNLDMWNKQNQFNSPATQVGRLLAAGINPASQFGNVTPASQVTSANAPSLNAPKNEFQMRPTDFSGISDAGINAVNAYNASRLAQAETRHRDALTGNTEIDSLFRMRSMADSLKFLHEQAKKEGWAGDLAKKQLEFYNATMQYDIQMKYGDTRMQQLSMQNLEKQMRYQDLQNDILEIQKGYASQMNQAQIAQLWSSVHQANAQIGLINANTFLTDAQREHEIEKKVGTIIDNGMKGVDLDVKKATKRIVIDNAFKKNIMLRQDEKFHPLVIGKKLMSLPVSLF